ncbi:hypothetical protein PR048_032859 [Dryococelus australis]|uniref:HTH psq-type domain-containing protein n=1 Tax=Dryococelus australis TaxID=614101 RepID=A0ABQ9G6C8_9NEOP|nr:hypothetical protein PR048_032859 [Dryococelus australis]
MAKRKQNELSLSTKISILSSVFNSGKTKSDVAKEFNIPLSTLSTIVRNKDRLEEACTSGMLKWFHQMQEGNIPVSGPVNKQKADYFALQLQRITPRNNLVYKTVCGESTTVDKDVAVSWLDSVQPVESRYAPCGIFNMDKTEEKIAMAANIVRHVGSTKLRPLIGKLKYPRYFKVTACCVQRKNGNFEQKSSSAAHTAHGLQFNNVTLMFLPANTTSIMQPLDQGIIHTVKRLYRLRLKYPQPKWNVQDGMRNIVTAWDSVSADTIQNCSAKSGFGKTGGGAEEESLDLEEG